MQGSNSLACLVVFLVQPLCRCNGIDEHDLGQAVTNLLGHGSALAECRDDLDAGECAVSYLGQESRRIVGLAGDGQLAGGQDARKRGNRA